MATKIHSDMALNKRRSFLLNATAFIVSVLSTGSFIRRPPGKSTPESSTDDGEQLTTDIIQPSIHPLAVPRSKESSK